MQKYRKSFAVIVAGAFALGLALSTHDAARAAGSSEGNVPQGNAGFVAPPGLENAGSVIDAATYREVAALTERITPYLIVGEDGLVRLADVTAAELGVTEKFLADFRLALDNSNQAITAGNIVVNADLTVSTNDTKFSAVPIGKGGNDVALQGALPAEPAPEWGAWQYPQGAIFYNTYPDWNYYRNAYYGLCNTMAAYLGYPWMSQSLLYFYGYNQSYFNRYCYNNSGIYFYMPYSYCAGGLGYKPAYFWGQQAMFNYGCGCYQYQWAWQGFWCRY